ncbi:MAG TPA: cytochrome c oxidase subunit 3 [Vicinamibacterales bacterium]|jgi:heme/copper-type cytochrome/quinol oxidase subunit 3
MNAIPYTVERRPDTGVNNVQLGMWLFIASEVMLFGGLFSAYFTLRAGAPSPWLPLRDHLAGAIAATIPLLAGTALTATTVRRLDRYRLSLALAVILALSFCAWKALEYQELFRAGHSPASSTLMATFFLLTGVHVLHVLGGIAATVWIVLRGGAVPDRGPTINRLRALTRYWTFVDIVWLVLLVLLYVV